jgi:acyl-coenzyme A synthetase/AMP-(fatty) acid ligase
VTIIQFFERALGQNPDKVFIKREVEECSGTYRYQNLTYGEFYRLVLDLASEMTRVEIGYRDRVFINLSRCPEAIACWFAANLLGAIAIITDSALTAEELAKRIALVEPKLIINQSDLERFLKWRPAGKTINFYQTKLNDIATLVFSSGTSGVLKAAMVTHQTYVMCGESFPYWFDLSITDEHCFYTCLSLGHINAGYSLMAAIELGATLIIGSKFNGGENFWKKISASGATVINTIGGMLGQLWERPEYS